MAKEKIKFFKCKHLESDYDGFDKYAWCHNSKCPTRECWCEKTVEMAVCPGFEKPENDKGFYLDISKEEVKETQNSFLKKLEDTLSKEHQESINETMKMLDRQNKMLNCLNLIKELLK